MRVAAIYDIHANLPALEAALIDIRGASVDVVVVGGNVLPGKTRAADKIGELGAGDRDRTGDIQLGKLAFYR